MSKTHIFRGNMCLPFVGVRNPLDLFLDINRRVDGLLSYFQSTDMTLTRCGGLQRTNTIALTPTQKQDQQLHTIADACARLWNEVTYRRRLSFFKGSLNWEWRDLYDKYKGVVGAATAQQIERKNGEAWRSFFALVKLKKKGHLPPHINRVRPPGYWKNRRTNKRKRIILIRCDLYRLESNLLKLPKKMLVKWQGNPKWTNWTKQGLLTITYDEIKHKWYAHQPVEVQPPHQPLFDKRAYVDLGIINLLTIVVEGNRQAIAYSGRPALSDWWFLSKKIDKLKSLAKLMNQRESTLQVRRLFRNRRLRFRQYVRTIVRRAIHDLWTRGVAKIVLGDLTGILGNTRGGRKSNAMRHNFWSHQYLVNCVREVAEEYGITVELVDERGTSSTCPRCCAQRITRRGRLFKCLSCGLEAHRDIVGAVNIGVVFGGRVNGVVAHPVEVSV